MMQYVLSVVVGVGLAAACGLRVFVPMLVLSIAARANAVALDSAMAWVGTTPALVALAIATVLEVVAYKVPVLDNVLDTIASPCAVIAGVLVAESQFHFIGTDGTMLRWAAAAVVGGGIAGVVQGATVLVRAKSTALTAGLANPVFAVIESSSAVVLSVLAVVAPALAAIVLLALFALAVRAIQRRIKASTAT
jgi:hypothetical protein